MSSDGVPQKRPLVDDTTSPTARKRMAVHVAAGVLLAVVGALDVWTGGEMSFSIFYLVPVALASWSQGHGSGLVFAVLGSAVWFGADVATQTHSHAAIPIWNAGVRLAFFVLTAIGLARIGRLLAAEKVLGRTDQLTGIANSRYFFEVLQKEVARAERSERPLTVAYVDLDGFKQVNDRDGHPAGDRVLREVANLLRQTVRVNDVVARLGGDEFAVLLPETNAEEAARAVERFQQHLEASMTQNGWAITGSVGVATFAKPPKTVEGIVRRADELMYRAKRAGKNRACAKTYDGSES